MLELLGIVEGHPRGLGRGADPDAQMVGVGAAALPQPRQRPGGDLGQPRGVGRVTKQLGTFGDQGGRRIRLDDALVLPVLGLLGSARLLAASLAHQVVDDHDHGRQSGDEQEVEAVEGECRASRHRSGASAARMGNGRAGISRGGAGNRSEVALSGGRMRGGRL